MEKLKSVPLRYEGSALPVYGSLQSQFSSAASSGFHIQFEPVRLDDTSQFVSIPMKWVDVPSEITSQGRS